MSSSEVLKIAASRIGYKAYNDSEPGSEAGRYCASKLNQKWLRGPSKHIWWCMCFVSMCFDKAGELGALGGIFYNTNTFKNANRTKIVPLASAKPGDVVLFDWNRDYSTDHVGIVEKNLGNGRIQTIEGNVKDSVRRCIRAAGINCVIRPSYKINNATIPQVQNSLIIDGRMGPATVRRWQLIMGAPATGVKGWPGEVVKKTQAWLNTVISEKDIETLTGYKKLYIDGFDGAKTWRLIQYVIWCWRKDIVDLYYPGAAFFQFVDGVTGLATIKAFQHALNDSKIGSNKLL